MSAGGRAALAMGLLALGACGKLQNFGGPEPPLVSFHARFDGDLAPLRPAGVTSERSLRLALVWGAQWLTEPFCVLPPESSEVAAVIAAGCRDPFGFVPSRVDASVALLPGEPVTLPLLQLPTADVLVGDVTARVAYGSLVVFDDRDGSDTLELSFPRRGPIGGPGGGPRVNPDVTDASDIVYGASFVTMTVPDQRVAYREGGFNENGAFYPRAGCPAPAPAFSIAAAGGFSAPAALAATLAGTLPAEDPATCSDGAPDAIEVGIPARAPAEVQEVSCDERSVTGAPRYREPPVEEPDFTDRKVACAHLPSFDTGGGLGGLLGGAGGAGGAAGAGDGNAGASQLQLVVSGRPTDRCKGVTHYVLRGCREDQSCGLPDWDYTADPTTIPWWPCPR